MLPPSPPDVTRGPGPKRDLSPTRGTDPLPTAIKETPSSPRPVRKQPGLFDRLVRRTKSLGVSKTPLVSSTSPSTAHYVSNHAGPQQQQQQEEEQKEDERPASRIYPSVAQHLQAPTLPSPSGLPDLPTPSSPKIMGTQLQQAPPTLKKKPSLRDRLKSSWHKPSTPAPTLEAIEEPKPRFVYQPKHAAADFSRMSVTPARPQNEPWRPATMKPQIVNIERPAVRHSQSQSSRRPENASRATSNASQPAYDVAPRRPSRASHEPSATPRRLSYQYPEDPFLASNAAVHIPVNQYPISWIPGEAGEQQLAALRDTDRQQQYGPQQHPAVVPAPPRREPQTDYEKFLAKALAEERERNDRVLRTMSQRSQAAALNRVPANPHLQYAAPTSSSNGMSAATTAVGGRTSNGASRSSVGGNGSNHRNSFHEGAIPAYQMKAKLVRIEPHQKHTRNSSWAASNTSDRDAEKRLERGGISSVQVYDVNENAAPKTSTDSNDKTLRRQVSIGQRISEYIRPPREDVGGAVTNKHRRRMPTTIGTLEE
ncbi:hypothetical protein QBC42DRAFT_293605 [Cladorrhinum samala]|uniref:Uncharacterized protein n=1 Tax=Cladorrhinum samala TaxID=585594 RepID=A0AAV9I224_9PEZI|nr:hypothetical protein QBC42DRAFT_293605 [Cladorrhinum samala]